MSESVVSSLDLSEFALWKKMEKKWMPLDFSLEITARCNNNCRHCFINLPAGDRVAKEKELSLEEISAIADEAVSLGAIWCLITGGEPLLREDFHDIYLALRRKGILPSVFTNATLITEEHIKFFKKYPPRVIEVTVYGVTEETYNRVTRRTGIFDAFMRGLDLLLNSGLRIRLKTMAMRSNIHEMPEITRFCEERTEDFFRFDPFLHLRFDGDPVRNEEIKSERLSAAEIVALEQSSPERSRALEDDCHKLIVPKFAENTDKYLFHCGVGAGSFKVGYDGIFRLCSSLLHPDCIYDLRKGTLSDAWHNLVPKVRSMKSDRKEFLEHCRVCPIIPLCMWCPAHAYLEVGELDAHIEEFCEVAHARARALSEAVGKRENAGSCVTSSDKKM